MIKIFFNETEPPPHPKKKEKKEKKLKLKVLLKSLSISINNYDKKNALKFQHITQKTSEQALSH